MPRIVLTGYIYRDPEGMFVSHCNELDTDTWAETMEAVRALTPHMITGYFVAAKNMGTLDRVLSELAAGRSVPGGTAVAEKWKAQPRDNGLQFDAQFSAAA